MKKIFVNLKRFEVSKKEGGICPIDDPLLWIDEIMKDSIKLGLGCLDNVFISYFLPEALIPTALNALSDFDEAKKLRFAIGCQSVFREDIVPGGNFGAFTSNRPAKAMKALGCEWALIAHSEERRDKLQMLATYDSNINEDQKVLIVGTSIDPITERIVRFLSSKAVQINVTTFNYHKLNDEEYLTRNVLLEELEIEQTDKTKKKREKSFYKKLFEQNKLYIGMKVYFGPGAELLGSINDSTIIATIENNSTKCLKYMNDNQLYSFSSLRKKITKDLNIENVKANWGFGGKYDWYSLDDRKALVELE